MLYVTIMKVQEERDRENKDNGWSNALNLETNVVVVGGSQREP